MYNLWVYIYSVYIYIISHYIKPFKTDAFPLVSWFANNLTSSLYSPSTHTTSLEDLKKNIILLGENQLLFVQNIGLLVYYANNHSCIITIKYK